MTGLGSGLFCAAVMLVLGFLDQLLFGASPDGVRRAVPAGVPAFTALWVRRGDLLTAPVVVPIAFAVGLVTVAESGKGWEGAADGTFVTRPGHGGLARLAVRRDAGAGSTVIVRRVRLLRRRRRRRPGAYGRVTAGSARGRGSAETGRFSPWPELSRDRGSAGTRRGSARGRDSAHDRAQPTTAQLHPTTEGSARNRQARPEAGSFQPTTGVQPETGRPSP
ncbi:hypothetical protein LV779_23705 [Streptomyces thinghirensis]|nr:hypothetical protein [Streptomyces thinghirensis]